MAITVEELQVVLTADITQLKAQINTATNDIKRQLGASENSANSFRESLNRITNAIGPMVVAYLSANTAMGAFQKIIDGMNNSKALIETADRLGLTANQLQAFRINAERSGSSAAALDKAFSQFNIRLQEAKDSSSEVANSLRALGVSYDQLAGMSKADAFKAVAESLANVPDAAEKAKLAMSFFDVSRGDGAALLTGFTDIRRNIEQINDDMKEFGLELTSVDVEAIKGATDTFDRLSDKIKGISTLASSSLAPAFETIAKSLLGIDSSSDEARKGWESTGRVLVTIYGSFLNIINAIKAMWKTAEFATSVVISGMMHIGQVIADNVLWAIEKLIAGFNVVTAYAQGTIDKVKALGSAALAMAKGDFSSIGNIANTMEEIAKATDKAVEAAKDTSIFKETRENLKALSDGAIEASSQKFEEMALAYEDALNDETEALLANFNAINERNNALAESNKLVQDQIVLAQEMSTVQLPEPISQNFKTIDAPDLSEFSLETGRQTEDAVSGNISTNMIGPTGLPVPYAQPDTETFTAEMQEMYDNLDVMSEDWASNQKQVAQGWNKNWKSNLNAISDALGTISTLMESDNRAMFEVGKAAAISKTVIDTYQGAMGAFSAMSSIPFAGPFLGAAAAAAVGAAGMMNISKIQSTKFGGRGGGAPSIPAIGGGGGGSDMAMIMSMMQAQNQQQPEKREIINKTNVAITLEGNSYSRDDVRSLIGSINESTDDNTSLMVQ